MIRHGPIGYAIYFHCLELIAAETSETNLTFELEHDSEIIADNLHVEGTATKSGIEIVEEVMRFIVDIGLFNEDGGRIFCFKLLKRLDLSMTSNPRFREMIASAKEENHDGVMILSCKQASKQTRIARKHINTCVADAPLIVKKFVKPTQEEVKAYCAERHNGVDADTFIAHYESNGWRVGRNPMKDWRAAVRTWERQADNFRAPGTSKLVEVAIAERSKVPPAPSKCCGVETRRSVSMAQCTVCGKTWELVGNEWVLS